MGQEEKQHLREYSSCKWINRTRGVLRGKKTHYNHKQISTSLSLLSLSEFCGLSEISTARSAVVRCSPARYAFPFPFSLSLRGGGFRWCGFCLSDLD
ncbi:hypothetical protein ACLB2K_059213 [Fragaria x ananassa]